MIVAFVNTVYTTPARFTGYCTVGSYNLRLLLDYPFYHVGIT